MAIPCLIYCRTSRMGWFRNRLTWSLHIQGLLLQMVQQCQKVISYSHDWCKVVVGGLFRQCDKPIYKNELGQTRGSQNPQLLRLRLLCKIACGFKSILHRYVNNFSRFVQKPRVAWYHTSRVPLIAPPVMCINTSIEYPTLTEKFGDVFLPPLSKCCKAKEESIASVGSFETPFYYCWRLQATKAALVRS